MVDTDLESILEHFYLKDSTSKSLAQQAKQSLSRRDAVFVELLQKGCLPEMGLDDTLIEYILYTLSAMDANNNEKISSMGEREGRMYSPLVAKRHFNFSHGIGRSGNISEIQPKAPGSAILQKLTARLVKSAMKECGLHLNKIGDVLILPVATGMALTLTLRMFSEKKPNAKYVLMPRIDQKSCVKCVYAAGLQLLIIQNQIVGDAICTDMDALSSTIQSIGADTILCVISVSSCFAPRICDDLPAIGRLCQANNIFHITNNAYGLQSSKALHYLNNSHIDVVVQSTDKNFMVPVGGSIIYGTLAKDISRMYPGRASISPILDLFITLLGMGRRGYRQLLDQRHLIFDDLLDKLNNIPQLRVLHTPKNDVSIAIALDQLPAELISTLGSKLFLRSVSGARVVISNNKSTRICGHDIVNFGSHHDSYPHAYLTVAASIGATLDDVDNFIRRLSKILS